MLVSWNEGRSFSKHIVLLVFARTLAEENSTVSKMSNTCHCFSNAVLTFGLSAEYATHTKYSEGPNEDVSVYSRYYVRSLLNLDEEALKNAWSKVRLDYVLLSQE
jgi:hypothetical protein